MLHRYLSSLKQGFIIIGKFMSTFTADQCYLEINTNETHLSNLCNAFLDTDPKTHGIEVNDQFIGSTEQTADNQETSVFDDTRIFPIHYIDPQVVISGSTFLKQINRKHKILETVIFKLHKNFYYRLHTDWKRGVGINMLLNREHNSHCLFVQNNSFIELEYKPNKLYLFNTQWPHTITNFGDTRYLLSIAFDKDKDQLSYAELCNDVKSLGLG